MDMLDERPKCNKCGSFIVDPHCDSAPDCPWVCCGACGSISDTKSDNYMKGNK